MSTKEINLLELLLRGELMIDIIYDRTNIKTENVIRYKELIADNGFQLHKSPLIFLYEPEDFGIETINDINYWFMDFGYGNDSEEFSKLIEGQPFEFIDNKIFGLHYELKKENSRSRSTSSSSARWTGNNIYYHIKENVKTINKYDIITRVSIIVSKNDQLKLVLKKYWGLSNDGPHGISQFL